MPEHELVDAVRGRTAVGFIGAGFSRSLGLPTFSQLVTELATDLDFDPELFASFGDPWTLAQFYVLQKLGVGDLRSRLDSEWHRDGIDIDGSRLHNALLALHLPIIYTTNWDRWIEVAHQRSGRPYQVVRNVADLRKASDGITQIVKYHGDFSDDESLVLTESSYFDRMELATPLDVKLLSDVIGRTILFMGYSLRDANIRFLLHRLHRMWVSSKFDAARPRSFVVMNRPNPVEEAVLKDWGVEAIVLDEGDATENASEFLERIAAEAHQ